MLKSFLLYYASLKSSGYPSGKPLIINLFLGSKVASCTEHLWIILAVIILQYKEKGLDIHFVILLHYKEKGHDIYFVLISPITINRAPITIHMLNGTTDCPPFFCSHFNVPISSSYLAIQFPCSTSTGA